MSGERKKKNIAALRLSISLRNYEEGYKDWRLKTFDQDEDKEAVRKLWNWWSCTCSCSYTCSYSSFDSRTYEHDNEQEHEHVHDGLYFLDSLKG